MLNFLWDASVILHSSFFICFHVDFHLVVGVERTVRADAQLGHAAIECRVKLRLARRPKKLRGKRAFIASATNKPELL